MPRDNNDSPLKEPVLVRLSDVTPERVRWLWPNRIGLGKLTLIAGDPGLGKSFITLDIAARVSRGSDWPDMPNATNPPGDVVLLSAEDDAADTIRPRLDAAGADVSRIASLAAIRITDRDSGCSREVPFDLAADLPALEAAVQETRDCRLVVIDPISAYLPTGPGFDSHKNADVRRLLAPLSRIASRYQLAIVAVTHLSKGDKPAMYRAMGSLAFIAAARAAWCVAKDKDDATGRRRLFLPMKNNLGNDQTGMAFSLVARGGERACVQWENGTVTVSADEALWADYGQHESAPERNDAADWLREALANGPMKAADVMAQGVENGFASKTLRRAHHDMGGKPRKESFNGPWLWELPAETAQAAEVCQDAPVLNEGNFGTDGHLRGDPEAVNVAEAAGELAPAEQVDRAPPESPPAGEQTRPAA